jgi:hypothetical protein
VGQDSFIDKEFVEKDDKLLFSLLEKLWVIPAKELLLGEGRQSRGVFE